MKINPDKNIELKTDRLLLKVLDETHSNQIIEYYYKNRFFFKDSMPDLPDNFYSVHYQIDRSLKEYKLMTRQRHIRFYIFKREDMYNNDIIGDITISDILWGGFLTCSLGYKIDKDNLRKGYATESIKAAIDYAFNKLNLERIIAHIKLHNIPSIKLIEKIGFTKEGISRKYIKIDGIRIDHLRYSLIKGDSNE